MLESVEIECPYCGERVEIDLDPESHGQMVRDCEVCCNPWLMTVRWDGVGTPSVEVEAAQ
jgi:hypothetical protein